ncbi:MAG TPA: TOMM precursor leader peptide-binding protein [Micromonosporaceae bacterium]|nr:TOMM precursor leader peptide-binding protein [Micromonosporaceae bacterium]
MTRTPLARPLLLPGLARLWRDRHTLQLGIDPSRAVLLEVADPATARLLDLLDGTRSERAILDQAAKIKIARDDARTLIDTLRAAGLVVGAHTLLPATLAEPARQRLGAEAAALALRSPDSPGTPAQILRRRAAARVVVTGPGRLAAPVAVALAQAGVGHVQPDLRGRVEPAELVGGGLIAADIGTPRSKAVAGAILRGAPGTVTRPVPRDRVDLVLQIGLDRPAALIAAGYAQRRQAYLLLDLRDGTAVVGPLVPGGGSPCLNCLDLHRQDRDPAWPELAAQLASAARQEPGSAPTLFAAVGYAAAEALTFLDGGRPETVGAAVEITDPARIRRRVWPPHPACDCTRRRRNRAEPLVNGTGEAVERTAEWADQRQSR